MKISPVLGIPIVYKPKLKKIAESRGIGPWKKICIGPSFFGFPPREQQAILLHEVGHCKLKHLEKRLANLWLIFRPALLAELCKRQEFEADRYAAGCGYGADLARAFLRLKVEPHPLQPDRDERVSRLLHAL